MFLGVVYIFNRTQSPPMVPQDLKEGTRVAYAEDTKENNKIVCRLLLASKI